MNYVGSPNSKDSPFLVLGAGSAFLKKAISCAVTKNAHRVLHVFFLNTEIFLILCRFLTT